MIAIQTLHYVSVCDMANAGRSGLLLFLERHHITRCRLFRTRLLMLLAAFHIPKHLLAKEALPAFDDLKRLTHLNPAFLEALRTLAKFRQSRN
jgi:hypothetical protein